MIVSRYEEGKCNMNKLIRCVCLSAVNCNERITISAKNNRRSWFDITACCLLASFASFTAICGGVVSNVRALQSFPWEQGKIVVVYDISGSVDDDSRLRVRAIDDESGITYECWSTEGGGLEPGTHKLVWDAKADKVDIRSGHVRFSVQINAGDYLVVDLSPGPAAERYRVIYVDTLDALMYRKDKLLLKRMKAGSFKMCGKSQVTLTQDYYVGVFEVTAAQYTRVMGGEIVDNLVPARNLSYVDIRGGDSGLKWPASDAVDETSFIGKLRDKTGIRFDLPTEAEWEYAARAGDTGDGGKGGLGYYYYWTDDWFEEERKWGPTNAGYYSNDWGIYDCLGNVAEWTRDRMGDLEGGNDPQGSKTATQYVVRGGCHLCQMRDVNQAASYVYRMSVSPTENIGAWIRTNWNGQSINWHQCRLGFRIACPR